MNPFARDCLDQAVRSLFWVFVIALVVARVFLGTHDALSTTGSVVGGVAPYVIGASVVLIAVRRMLGK